MRSNSMHMKPIVASDIIKIIDNFNPNKSAGHENVGNYIIKKVGKEIVKTIDKYIQFIAVNRCCAR